MSNVIVFTSDRCRGSSVEDGRSAAILFFTGVRYERQDDATEQGASAGPATEVNELPEACVQPSGRLKA